MLVLPDVVPGTPDVRSPGRFLLWLARRQWRTLGLGIAFGMIWMVSQALLPWAVGRTVDRGVSARDPRALAVWCSVLATLGLVQVASGVLRHRMAAFNWLQASIRTQQLIGHHVADAGTAVASQVTTGEVVSTVANDAPRVGEIFDISARFAGSLAAYAVVAGLLLRIDVTLGLLVLVGVPVLATSLGVVVRPLQARQHAQREAEGELTALGADTVAGLRVLRGIGGEPQFVERYRARSQSVRAAGVRIAAVQATLDAAEVLLPGAFVVVLTWLGAHAALAGSITAGELVTLYGYAAFLVMPLSTATETLNKAVRARVATGRIVAVLRVRPATAGSAAPVQQLPADSSADWTAGSHVLVDPASGLRLEPGLLTAVVSAQPVDSTALAHRLARLEADLPTIPAGSPPSPTLDGTPIDGLPVEGLRRTILVNEAEPRLFTGTVRGEVDPSARHCDAEVLTALHVADAHDVLDALPDGLDSLVEERGRSFSGGQRQRLVLARALLADPPVLVLIEPTSAVDAHTEARIAQRLAAARSGRTTLLTTTSPLLLECTDRVAFLVDGQVIAQGTHRQLLNAVPAYRDTVIRGEDES